MTDQARGKLKVFMGYAAGVGKTYKMLEEAHVLKSQGLDIVVGYFEPHGRQETIAKAKGLDAIPRKRLDYRGASFEEMDAEGIVARHPQVCVVDELPHTNVPGSARNKRWEDVAVLLKLGIDILTTMNIQHLESLNDQVRNITGITVRETVPDWMIEQADEVVMVDLTPRALLHRLERGVVYSAEQAQRALQNFFREPTLVALRELALREAAHEVERRITSEETGAQVEVEVGERPGRHQKILVYLTADPKTAMATRRAKRVSDFLRARCFAVAVQPSGDLSRLAEGERKAVQKHLSFAGNLQIETQILKGGDPASTLIDFARHHQITQIFVTRPQGRSWPLARSRDPVQQLIALAKDMQIVIVSDREGMAQQ
jgi:two-component system sensor histidine kinase KdpD